MMFVLYMRLSDFPLHYVDGYKARYCAEHLCVWNLNEKKTQFEHLAEGLSKIGFINLLSTFPTLMQPLLGDKTFLQGENYWIS